MDRVLSCPNQSVALCCLLGHTMYYTNIQTCVAKQILRSTYLRWAITFLSNLSAKVKQDFVSISHVCNGGSNMSQV